MMDIVAEVTIEDFDEITNCPMCTAPLRGDTTKGRIIKVCTAERVHGYFTVNYDKNTWMVEFFPGSP